MTRIHPTCYLRAPRALVAAAAVACLAAGPTAWPAQAGDLAQVVGGDEAVAPAGDEATIDHGHVDIGAQVIDGQAKFLARDDSAAAPVWRHLDDVVFRVGDAAQLTVPDGDDFSFVGAQGSSPVWTVPQTEIADVPWLGWNTQAPSLVETVDRGVDMEFLGHSGPGEFSLFLQNGGFEPPEVLWSTKAGKADSFWVDSGTHTHANWVFTDPGIHQVGIRLHAQTRSGEDLSTDGILTFAVGSAADADPAQAHQAQWDQAAARTGAEEGPAPHWLIGAGLAVAALVAIAVVAVVLRRRKEEGRA
ncbi:choice-of-anchor M domain-containing protein [Corynebacterium confusum]|uniref:choice-of-anchor M domain-containing protein n=1 Tax=Corynebacterium confusum TaxID=71254 RepID=UPI0025B2E78D|nr:choice-of-anchor M domain-containing protein [Corynebacterium confusum]WJY89613.1 hypothetical protein CCONF_05355 [Corynebacterium confusum]